MIDSLSIMRWTLIIERYFLLIDKEVYHMKRSITVCLTLFLSLVMLSVTYAEGIEGDFNDATQSQEVIADTVESVAHESDELMLTADGNPADVNTSEASAPNDRAVSAPVPKSGSCAHSKYSKITGGYNKYSKLNSKQHSVTALIPDDPSVTGVNCYFVKCDSCGEVGFFFDDGWDKRVTWESEGEAFYYEYSIICTEKQYNEAHTFTSGKCSKCGYKSTATTTVKLNKKSVTLGVKETYKLTAKVSPASKAKNLRYKSTNTKVATVNAKTGKITAKKAGTAKIQARIGTKTLATCKVTVKKAPETVTLNKTKVTIEKGKSFQLKATPNEGTYTSKFTWTSSNKKVAKVNSKGKVTAVGKGTATITVKATNGKRAKCKVTVKVGDLASNKIELKKYMGKDVEETARALGLFYRTSVYTDNETIDLSDDYDNYNGLVAMIGIYNHNEKHCIEGVCLGMLHNTAKNKLIDDGYTYSVETVDSQKRYVFKKGKYTIDYSLENGEVQGLYIYM